MTSAGLTSRQDSPARQPDDLAAAVVRHARRLGFDRCRILPVGAAPHADFFDSWLAADRAGEMSYLTRHATKRRRPDLLAEGEAGPFRSLIVLAVDYHQFDLPPALRDDPSRGLIASYAWGDDYHEIIRPLLYDLDSFIRSRTGRTTLGKCLVDTGPVLERDWAHVAGIGFTGKNCCTIRPGAGSWLFLATVMTPEVLAYDPPPALAGPTLSADAVLEGLSWDGSYGAWELPADDAGPDAAARTGACGRCTLPVRLPCAFVGPYHLDPQRCISYWTIERQPVPRPAPALRQPHFRLRHLPGSVPLEPAPCATLAAAGRAACPCGSYRRRRCWRASRRRRPIGWTSRLFGRSSAAHPCAKRSGMLRNVCIALGNWGDPGTLLALRSALHDSAALARATQLGRWDELSRCTAMTGQPAP